MDYVVMKNGEVFFKEEKSFLDFQGLSIEFNRFQ